METTANTIIDHNVIAELKAIGGTEALFNRVANHFVEKVPGRLAEIEGIAGSQDVGALGQCGACAEIGGVEPWREAGGEGLRESGTSGAHGPSLCGARPGGHHRV